MNKLIEMKNIKKIYNGSEGKVAALDGIDLAIYSGELVGIVGQSGSGKSTLMNILGFLDAPTHGSYVLDSMPTERLSDRMLTKLRRKNIGFVFQGFRLIPTLTALENTELPLAYQRLSASERHDRAKKALDTVGLYDRINHRPGQLSGGQQQRVAIARAIAGNPKIILADEPTGNLDPESTDQIMRLLTSLSPDHTVIIITHDERAAESLPRLIRIDHGKII